MQPATVVAMALRALVVEELRPCGRRLLLPARRLRQWIHPRMVLHRNPPQPHPVRRSHQKPCRDHGTHRSCCSSA